MNKSTLRWISTAWFVLAVAAFPLRAADSSASFDYADNDNSVAAVRAADEVRVAASIALDRERLASVLSDELHYAHSNGAIDSKESYIDSIISGRSVYETYDYQKRTFTPVAPGVVLMTGRVHIQSRNANGPFRLDLNFLAVWRKEGGAWRFFAWQSCRNPAPPAPPVPPAPPAAPGDVKIN